MTDRDEEEPMNDHDTRQPEPSGATRRQFLGGLTTGGLAIGALTLTRWYAGHVLVLPLALLGLVAAHLYLMRRHGISGPVTPRPGRSQMFFPHQAARDFLRCTSRMDTAAGVTPGTRAAWPTVAGRSCASFWRTSFERPATCA